MRIYLACTHSIRGDSSFVHQLAARAQLTTSDMPYDSPSYLSQARQTHIVKGELKTRANVKWCLQSTIEADGTQRRMIPIEDAHYGWDRVDGNALQINNRTSIRGKIRKL
ncbi:hypothetical protein RSAG8_13837, partial [Rhizoctonia solani AG-8 WAC10335]